jgi:pimeloyl-ACP methyl ester carboxylesterase
MSAFPSTACPRLASSADAPDCTQRLLLAECLDRWHREAQTGVVDTGRYRCRYVVWGRGPTLVLIPGIASEALSFVMLMARLQSHFRCISFDLPDGVDDGARPRTYRHEELTSDLFALIDHLNVRECTLLGFSFGSTIALAAAHRQPQRFSRVILQGGFACRPLSRAEVFCAAFARFLPGRLKHVPLMERILERNHRAPFLAREPAVWNFFLERHLNVPLGALASRVMMVHRLDLRPTLPAIRQPVLLVCGDRDPIVGRTCEQELKRGLPNVARAEIEQCGHQPHLTHPEVLAEVVQQFTSSGCDSEVAHRHRDA